MLSAWTGLGALGNSPCHPLREMSDVTINAHLESHFFDEGF